MSFIRIRNVNGTNYFYLVENHRVDGKVKQRLIRYFGKELPKEYMTKLIAQKIRLS